MSDADLARKFHGLVDPVLGAARADRWLETCGGLADAADVATLTALARPAGPAPAGPSPMTARRTLVAALACGVTLALGSAAAIAQAYPDHPIRVIVPFSPGGAVDGPMRLIAQEMSKRLGQQVVVENKPGAGATIGSELVAKAAADGYTLLLASQTNAISASLYRALAYDPVEDFAPISLIGREPGVLVVIPALPVNTVAEFIAYAKARPGKVDYASSGNGSGQHLFMALFASMTDMKLNHVPYRGSGQATTDLLGGTVPASIPGHRGHGRPHQGGQAARAGGDGRHALAAAARRADDGRSRRARLRGVRLAGPDGAEGHAAVDHHAPQSRSRRCAGNARGARLHGDRRHRDRRLHARRVRRVLPRGTRPVGEGRARNRRPHRMSDRRTRAATMREPRMNAVTGNEHWTRKGDVRLFLWEKFVDSPEGKPAVLFVHGSSMASQPTFDLVVPGRARFVGDGLVRAARLRLLVRRHGRLRPLGQVARHLLRHRQRRRRPRRRHRLHRRQRAASTRFLTYGISSGALRAALFAQRHPERVARLALDAFVWTGEGAPTLAQRRKKLPEFLASKRRPIDRAFVYSIFERDHPDCAERRVVDAFADAILALDDSMPNGTYIDMCSKLPVERPRADHRADDGACAASTTASPPSTT